MLYRHNKINILYIIEYFDIMVSGKGGIKKMKYRDYKGRRTDEIKENDVCLLGDIVEGGEDLSAILEDESYFSYEWQMIVYFEVLEKINFFQEKQWGNEVIFSYPKNILDTKIKIIELYEVNDV